MPRKRKIDAETSHIIEEEEELRLMAQGRGWAIARNRLLRLLSDNSSLLDLKGEHDDILREIGMRQGAVKMVLEWLSEIESAKITVKLVREQAAEDFKNDIIKRFDEE